MYPDFVLKAIIKKVNSNEISKKSHSNSLYLLASWWGSPHDLRHVKQFGKTVHRCGIVFNPFSNRFDAALGSFWNRVDIAFEGIWLRFG